MILAIRICVILCYFYYFIHSELARRFDCESFITCDSYPPATPPFTGLDLAKIACMYVKIIPDDCFSTLFVSLNSS